MKKHPPRKLGNEYEPALHLSIPPFEIKNLDAPDPSSGHAFYLTYHSYAFSKDL